MSRRAFAPAASWNSIAARLVGSRRTYSFRSSDLDPRSLSITKTENPTKLGKLEDLVFGRTFTGLSFPTASTRQSDILGVVQEKDFVC